MFNLQFWLKKEKKWHPLSKSAYLIKKEPLPVISTKKQTFLLIILTGKMNFFDVLFIVKGISICA